MTTHIQFIEQTVCCDPSMESFFATEEILALALKRGSKKAATIPTKDMEQYYLQTEPTIFHRQPARYFFWQLHKDLHYHEHGIVVIAGAKRMKLLTKP